MTRLSVIAIGVALSLIPGPAWSGHSQSIAVVKMELSIKPVQTKYGKLGGYSPLILSVHVGQRLRWKNVDAEAHTATSTGFVNDGRVPTGHTISPSPWSSGEVDAKGQSRVFVAAKPGVYHYGCGYHFKLGQRGVIVVLR